MPVQITSVHTLSFTLNDETLRLPQTLRARDEFERPCLDRLRHQQPDAGQLRCNPQFQPLWRVGRLFRQRRFDHQPTRRDPLPLSCGIWAGVSGISIVNFGTVTGLGGPFSQAIEMDVAGIALDNLGLIYGNNVGVADFGGNLPNQ